MDLSDRSRTLIEKSTSLPKALVAAIGVGVAFGGGLVIGGIGKADASVVVAPASDPIATALVRTKAYEERMKAVDLTWHKELTAFDPALPPPPKPSSSTSKPTKPAPAPLSEEPSSSPIVDKAVVTAPPPPEPTVKVAARASDVDAGVADDDDDNVKASRYAAVRSVQVRFSQNHDIGLTDCRCSIPAFANTGESRSKSR